MCEDESAYIMMTYYLISKTTTTTAIIIMTRIARTMTAMAQPGRPVGAVVGSTVGAGVVMSWFTAAWILMLTNIS